MLSRGSARLMTGCGAGFLAKLDYVRLKQVLRSFLASVIEGFILLGDWMGNIRRGNDGMGCACFG